jgi:outer membrane lipoprotein SlyB
MGRRTSSAPSVRAWAACIGLVLAGCATTEKPVLYPNSHYRAVGKTASERDIQECIQLSRDHEVNEKRDGKVGQSAAAGAAIGGAAAGAWGLVRDPDDALERAAAGAAAGAAGGAVKGAVRSSETSSLYKKFVQRCLTDLGYDVIGWQ